MRTQTRPLLFVLLACLCLPAVAAEVRAVVGWGQRVDLGTLVSGVIAEVHVRQGQQVARGDVLVSLDQRGFVSQVNRRGAEVQHAKAMLEEAMRDDERAAELYDRTVLSDFERNQAAIALKAAKAALERARAELVDARLDLERSVIKAPFDGIVLAVEAAPGQSVVSELQSRPLVTLGDVQRLRARGLVDSAQAGALQPGMPLKASVRGATIDARVGHVGYEPVTKDGEDQLYELFVDLDAAPGSVRIGQTVVLELEP